MADFEAQFQTLAEQLSALTARKFEVIPSSESWTNMAVKGYFVYRERIQESYQHFFSHQKVWGTVLEPLVDPNEPEEIEESRISTFYDSQPNFIQNEDGKFQFIIHFPTEDAFTKFCYFIEKDIEDTAKLKDEYQLAITMAEQLNLILPNDMVEWIAGSHKAWLVYGDQEYHPNAAIHYVKPHLRLYLTKEATEIPKKAPMSLLQQMVMQCLNLGLCTAKQGHEADYEGQPSMDYVEIRTDDAPKITLLASILSANASEVAQAERDDMQQNIRETVTNYGEISFLKHI